MADLTPDEVMAAHVKYELSTGEITFCRICDDECPCETYEMAERAKTVEARVTALEAVAREQAHDEMLWFVAETVSEAYLQQELRRLHAAVELMEGE